jgi:hypothetical protein
MRCLPIRLELKWIRTPQRNANSKGCLSWAVPHTWVCGQAKAIRLSAVPHTWVCGQAKAGSIRLSAVPHTWVCGQHSLTSLLKMLQKSWRAVMAEVSYYSFRFVLFWNEYPWLPSSSWAKPRQMSLVPHLSPSHQPGDHLRRTRHAHPGRLQSGHLVGRRAHTPLDDRPGVPHARVQRRRQHPAACFCSP